MRLLIPKYLLPQGAFSYISMASITTLLATCLIPEWNLGQKFLFQRYA